MADFDIDIRGLQKILSKLTLVGFCPIQLKDVSLKTAHIVTNTILIMMWNNYYIFL